MWWICNSHLSEGPGINSMFLFLLQMNVMCSYYLSWECMAIFLVVCSKKVYLRALCFGFSVIVFHLSSQWHVSFVCLTVKKNVSVNQSQKIMSVYTWMVRSLIQDMISSGPTYLENSDPSNQTCLLLMGQCWTDIAFLCLV